MRLSTIIAPLFVTLAIAAPTPQLGERIGDRISGIGERIGDRISGFGERVGS